MDDLDLAAAPITGLLLSREAMATLEGRRRALSVFETRTGAQRHTRQAQPVSGIGPEEVDDGGRRRYLGHPFRPLGAWRGQAALVELLLWAAPRHRLARVDPLGADGAGRHVYRSL